MEKNDIKKTLYRKNPTAYFSSVSKTGAMYYVNIEEECIWFNVPLDDLGDATFFADMQAKLLIRYLL